MTILLLAMLLNWKTLKFSDGRAIKFLVSADMPVSGAFRTSIIIDLPDGPGSVEMYIQGDCQARNYEILALSDYSGKMATGKVTAIANAGDFDPELRPVPPDSPIDSMFSVVCK